MAIFKALIDKINEAIEQYFAQNKSIDVIRPKNLMPLLIKNGVFEKDYKDGLPLRRILRELERTNKLHLIPAIYADYKAKRINWYFLRNHDSKPYSIAKSETNLSKQSKGKDDQDYVVDLCDEILGSKASREHRFPFLLGDKGKNGRQVRLPVDAYYESLSIVVEYRERQHTETVKHFDKPDVMTVSGVHRGEQRKIYDQRRRELLPKHGIILIEISYKDFDYDNRKRIIRNKKSDIEVIKRLLISRGINL